MAGEGVTEGLLRDVARELLRRDNLEDDVIRDAASRLAGLVARLRAFGEELLADMPPAMAFDPGHPAYRMAPGLNAADLERLGVAGGTGYGATVPERGDRDEAGAPGGSPGQRSRGSQSQPDGTESWAAPAGRALASDELAGLTAGELVDAFRAGRLGVVEVTRAVLERIERYEPSLRAFVTVLADRALATAERRERELAELRRHGEEPPPLFGVPVALKDLIDVEGVPTTAGSRVLAGHVAARNATVTERLERAGAVIIGKTATHEFAFGATTDTPFHGPVHNPWNLGHSAGGSSGGSGAAVGAGIVPVAMGTDTGGSIRIPAAACGTVGLKPSYGRVSRHGTIPLSWSLDHTGPLAVTVADAARVLEVIAGPDPLDPAAVNVPATGLLAAAQEGAERGLEGIRVGVLGRWARDRIHPEVAEAFQRAVEVLAALGARVEEVEDDAFPPPGVPALVNRVLALAEGGAYHAATLARQAEDYSREVRVRFELGQFLLARDYLLAQRLRTELARRAGHLMERFDVLVAPTLPIPAPRLGQATWQAEGADPEPVPEAMIRLTAPFNVTGQPALSVAVGVGASGLPLGMQIVGRPFDEATVIRVGAAYERARGPLPR